MASVAEKNVLITEKVRLGENIALENKSLIKTPCGFYK